MPEINRESNPTNMFWCLVDRATGAQNHDIFWNFTVGDRVKIRLVNEMESDHPIGSGRRRITWPQGLRDG